jgi:hypothetical protein
MTHRSFLLTAIIVTTVGISAAHAQTPEQIRAQWLATLRPTSPYELNVYVGIWTMENDNEVFGVQVSRRETSWLATEAAFDSGHNQAHRYAQVSTSVRLLLPTNDPSGAPFISVGLAAAKGLSYKTTPMVSAGVIHMDNPFVGYRIEIQLFRNGHGLRDRGRLMAGMRIWW